MKVVMGYSNKSKFLEIVNALFLSIRATVTNPNNNTRDKTDKVIKKMGVEMKASIVIPKSIKIKPASNSEMDIKIKSKAIYTIL